ncbi:MFS transporter [Streptomyces jeddahensis]|uniref:Hexuronate transporter n=1 Tax=Streptomyces jeddahensis TaxID=1716141 RepID=A0A177HQZ0_9ACTN|nr:MFS transporter [Streptomyces jeddahensis]OAH13009.1 hexuronate transporter [Streptomyces jeddahensis]
MRDLLGSGRPVAASVATAEPRPVFSGRYQQLWMFLLLGWLISYADRTVTGPVIAWMIENKAGFIGDAANPATLGGLIGSMFFTGYMLTQYAGGRLGDRYGHREMLVLSLVWAGVMTFVSGVVTGLVAFVVARVLTGLGEGVFYSNDRTLVIGHTPPERRTMGLGVVISGLSIGLTVGVVATPYLIDWGGSLGMGGRAWSMPLYVLGIVSLLVAAATWAFFRARGDRPLRLGPPLVRLLAYSLPSAVAITGLFLLTERLGWPDWLTAVGSGVLAAAMIAVVVREIVRTGRSGVLLTKNMWLLYIAFIAVMWNLWFFSFWSVQIVKESTHSSLIAAALTAAFNAGAGIIGFPLGGWLADRQVRRGKGRKSLAIACAVAHTVLAVAFGLSLLAGRPSLWLLGLILFVSGLFFNALQPIVHSMLGDQVPDEQRGSAFGVFNLVAEIGAVASPVVSGVMRDATGSWAPGVFTAAGIMAVSVVLYALVRERVPGGAAA